MIFKKSITLKLIYECKLLKVKNENNLIDKKLLLFVANSIINNLSILSSC